MSHTIVRGEPTEAQLYLDTVLNDILLDKGIQPDPNERDKVTLAEAVFHNLKTNPNGLYMINGATGERFTNEHILKAAVRIARALSATSKCLKGSTVMILMRNHERLVSTYWATLFSGVLPFMMDPNATVYEINYYLELIKPNHVFCDREHFENMNRAMENLFEKPKVVIADEEDTLQEYTYGFSSEYQNYEISKSSASASVMLLPTSGSTGYPKAALMSNRGLVAQLPSQWAYHSEFPRPTDLVMLLTTVQWATFTMTMTSCVMFQVPLLISPKKPTVEHVTEMIEGFRPTWTFFAPAFAKALVASIQPDQLSSLQTVILLGAPATAELMSAFKKKLPKTAHLCDSYGSTETQGFIAIPDREAPTNSHGRVINILHYKLLDDDGIQVKPGNNGELYVKGDCVIKGYYRNNDSYDESFDDGWYRTGDWMHIDHNERLYYLERRKFSFKFRGHQVAPEEVEAVISTVPGVHESVVCATDNGPAAAVVFHPNCKAGKEQIHAAVNSTLSEHKRLHGGLAIVPNLPHTHSGKLKRSECKTLLQQLIKEGKCL